jgi:hypothetical protein
MAQVNTQAIILYGTRSVGSMHVDSGTLRGEGGPTHPQLVVPLTIEMSVQPESAMIAVTAIKASLSTEQNAPPYKAICSPVEEFLIPNFAHSAPDVTREHQSELRFTLDPREVEALERHRQSVAAEAFILYLTVKPLVAGLRNFNTYRSTTDDCEWDRQYGMLSEVLPFWTSSLLQPLWIQVEQSMWLRSVLPGLGYDRLRLLELSFPPPLPDHPSASAQFDKARKALDQRRYGDCIQECRGLLNMWEKQYGANTKNLVADVVKGDRRWPDGDIRRDLLDVLWKEVGDVANAPHHPEGNVNAESFDGRDARLILLLTAALSEYVERR